MWFSLSRFCQLSTLESNAVTNFVWRSFPHDLWEYVTAGTNLCWGPLDTCCVGELQSIAHYRGTYLDGTHYHPVWYGVFSYVHPNKSRTYLSIATWGGNCIWKQLGEIVGTVRIKEISTLHSIFLCMLLSYTLHLAWNHPNQPVCETKSLPYVSLYKLLVIYKQEFKLVPYHVELQLLENIRGVTH